jgi:tetratricopeptide (TPR) repeat protein
MSTALTAIDEVTAAACGLCEDGRWEEAVALLERQLRRWCDKDDKARLNVALVRVYNDNDWALGLHHAPRKHALLDEAEGSASGPLQADVLFERGIALHLEFIMAEGDPERELECFTRAADLYLQCGDQEKAALATAYMGIFHHVVRLDRAAAKPVLWRAYEMSAAEGSTARSEAARHLGQIQQELGDPAGSLPLLEESLRNRAEAGQSRHLASALHALGFACMEAGYLDRAQDYLQRARENAERYHNRFFLAMLARTEADLTFNRYLGPATRGRTHP